MGERSILKGATMLKSFFCAALLMSAGLAVAPALAREAVPLVEPPPIAVPQNAGIPVVQRSILAAGLGREWKFGGSEPGVILLTYAKDDYSVTVAVTYDTKQVAIAYRDSSNFEYSKDGDGQEMIHPRYANWMRYLVHDIKEQLHDRAANAQDKPS
jgi:hypothetical protein